MHSSYYCNLFVIENSVPETTRTIFYALSMNLPLQSKTMFWGNKNAVLFKHKISYPKYKYPLKA